MTRRERMERRVERREEWADKAKAEAARRFDTAHKMADGIPPGQPILVGHHSEKRHRRHLERMAGNMRKGGEASDRAELHNSKASNLADALERTIFDDDPDAIERLEARALLLDAEADRKVALNKAWRKAGSPGPEDAEPWAAIALQVGGDAGKLRLAFAKLRGYHWKKDCAPHDGYEMSNLRKRATTDRQRIASIRKNRAKLAEAAESPFGVMLKVGKPDAISGNDWACVTFAEKPSRDVLDALRAAGFYWSAPSWHGYAAKVPQVVRDMLPAGGAT